MFCYRISKYDPRLFVEGKYIKDEWTDYSDIGKIYNKKTLTFEDYVIVESNYINCILNVLNAIKCFNLKIENLEKYEDVLWNDYQKITITDIDLLLKDCFRNKCWCKISSENFCLCLGYDFYLHLCCDLQVDSINAICTKHSLFQQQISGRFCD